MSVKSYITGLAIFCFSIIISPFIAEKFGVMGVPAALIIILVCGIICIKIMDRKGE